MIYVIVMGLFNHISMVVLYGDGGLLVYCTDGFVRDGVCLSMLKPCCLTCSL